ncbi:MAG: hypothetical protein ABI663_02040 [Chryseolinea sp.]
MIRFFVVLLSSALLIGGLVWMAHELLWIAKFPSFFYQTLIFLTFGTGLMFRYLYRINKPEMFVQFYLFMMVVKILAFGAYAFFIVLKDRVGATYNIVFFMICYFIFTALEIAFLFRKTNRDHTT